MRVLIVKTSSLGDLVHMLPAISDIQKTYPQAQLDWLAESAFAEIPNWHPFVAETYSSSMRRWRKALFAASTWREIALLRNNLKAMNYDIVIDSQGLLKSALWVTQTKAAMKYGFDAASARESTSACFYNRPIKVDQQLHAIDRNRLLCAKALDYTADLENINYGLARQSFESKEDRWRMSLKTTPYIVGLHGTSRAEKEWSVSSWIELARRIADDGLNLHLPWGNDTEHERAKFIAAKAHNAVVLPKLKLTAIAQHLLHAEGVVGVDTGLMHVAAAIGKAGVAIYPYTRPELTGARNNTAAQKQISVLSSNDSDLSASTVYNKLMINMAA